MSFFVHKGDTGSLQSGHASSVASEDVRPEYLSDKELVIAVENLATSNHNVALENEILERYLVRAEPSAAIGLQQLLEQAAASAAIHSRLQAVTSAVVPRSSSSSSLKALSTDHRDHSPSPGSSRLSYSVIKFGTASHADKGPRVNVNQKMDMVGREIDEIRHDLETLNTRSQQSRINVRAQLEGSRLMLQELKESEETLETRVVQGVDKLTGRIPAEKFVRHMEEWLKKADSTIEKLRLRTSTLRGLNLRVQQQLVEKEELGERIHPVDFVQLQIDNKDLIERLEQKNYSLIELKKVTAKSALALTNHKNQLIGQVNELANLRSTVTEREAQKQSLVHEGDRVEIEVEKANDNYESIKDLMSRYTVPDVMEYVRKKAELNNLRKAVKVWTRRTQIQQTALRSCNATLRRLPPESQMHCIENITTSSFKLAGANGNKDASLDGCKSSVKD